MTARSMPQQSFGTRAWNFFHQRKRDIFFASVAIFALGTVARRELMMKGVVRPPDAPQVNPRVERKFGQQK